MTLKEEILEVGQRWIEAELARDAAALDELGADQLRLVGPVGFVLDRDQWLDRYRRDTALQLHELQWDEVEVRQYGDTVVAIGVQTQRGNYAGNPADGRFRVTQVLVREADRWKIASLHFSPIGGPPPSAAPTGARGAAAAGGRPGDHRLEG